MSPDRHSHHAALRIWDSILLTAGFGYLVLVFCVNVQCLPFAVAFVALAGQALLHSHVDKR